MRVFPHSAQANKAVAGQIADLIRERAAEGRNCVLGLATGNTPVGVYDELVRLHREEGLSLANVVTFNLDEYYPMQPNELQSYVRFMREHLFDLVDIPAGNWHVPDGTLPIEQVADYLHVVRRANRGGGRHRYPALGHRPHGAHRVQRARFGQGKPHAADHARSRDADRRGQRLLRPGERAAAGDHDGRRHDSRCAARSSCWRSASTRRRLLRKAVEGEISSSIAASFLQEHPNAEVVLDEAAADALTRYRTPWLLGPVEWDEHKVRKAVIWLARKLDKAILKLTDHDYNEEGLQDLLADRGPAYDINIKVFRHLQSTITGWPGGKPAHAKQPGDQPRSREQIFPKRVLVFSPHPDDDVISMGGTLIRLADQGHEVHVAYQTSGNIAVFDDDAIRFADFVTEFNTHFDVSPERAARAGSARRGVSAPQAAGAGR